MRAIAHATTNCSFRGSGDRGDEVVLSNILQVTLEP